MSDQLSRRVENGEEKDSVKIFKNAQEAIDAVQKDRAVGIYEDTYMDQMNPNYIVFYDPEPFQKFEKTLTDLRNQPGGSSKRWELFEELKELAGSNNIEPGNLQWLYRSEWAITPQQLLDDEDSTRTQLEDNDWFDHQKEHFSREKIESTRLDWEEEQALQEQIWIESGGDDDEFPYDPDDDRSDENDDVDKLTEEPFDDELSIRDPNPPKELGISREEIEKGTDN